MRGLYSNDVVETIKSRPKGGCVLYDAILSLAENEDEYGRSWKEVYPDIMMAYRANHQVTYVLGDHGKFRAYEIIVLLGRVDLLRAMLSPRSQVITLLDGDRSNIMSCAAWCNNVEIFKLCFNRFSQFFNLHANLSMFYALQNGSVEVFNTICDSNVLLGRVDLRRAVNIAYSKGNIDIIKLMISKLQIKNASQLAIENAAINNDVSFFREIYDESKPLYSLKMFSEKKVLDVKRDLGVTPIATAVFMGSWDVVRFLFVLGCH